MPAVGSSLLNTIYTHGQILKERLSINIPNRDILSGIPKQLELDKYHRRGRLTRANCCMKRVLMLRHMTELTENYIVTLIIDHFEQGIIPGEYKISPV